MKTRIATLLILALCSTGCIAAAAGVAAHRASESRQEAARTSAKTSSDTAAYNQYISQMEQVNFQREKNGMKPEPILSFEEWKATH